MTPCWTWIACVMLWRICGKMSKDDRSWFVEINIVSNEWGRYYITNETMLSIDLYANYPKAQLSWDSLR